MLHKGTFRADEAIKYLTEKIEFDTVLDIGAGEGLQSQYFRDQGKTVTSTDLFGWGENFFVGNYMDLEFEPHDVTWASHMLEHQLNAHNFLKKVRKETKVGGYTCITVPPPKHEIVGGHVSMWNAGLMMYHLVLAGFNCSNARVKQYGYNITVIAQADEFDLPSDLEYDMGDIEKLKPWLPSIARQGFNGDIKELNWS